MATKKTISLFHGKTNVVEITDETGHKAYVAPGTPMSQVFSANQATGFDIYNSTTKHVFFLMRNGEEVTRFKLAQKLVGKSKPELASMGKKLQLCPVFNEDKHKELNTMADSLKQVLTESGFSGAELKEALAEEGLDSQAIDAQCWVPTVCEAGALTPLQETAMQF